MSYNNFSFQRSGGASYQSSPYARPSSNRGFGNWKKSSYGNNRSGNWQRPASGKPRSKCREIVKGNVLYITGWKATRRGLLSIFVAPPKHDKTVTSKNGRVWKTCRVSVTNINAGSKSLFPGFIDPNTHKVFVKELRMLINPQSGFISFLPKKGR